MPKGSQPWDPPKFCILLPSSKLIKTYDSNLQLETVHPWLVERASLLDRSQSISQLF